MRTGYNTRPYEKHMEVFQNFSGGLNTVDSPESMLDNELMDMANQDLGERGSLKRRHGLTKLRTLPGGLHQGYFRLYKPDGSYDELDAIDGKLYLNANSMDAVFLNITNLPGSTFQNTRMIEAVQYGSILYIATGTKLIQWDGTTAQVIEPYEPTTMEMTYVGSNALAPNPEGHLTDTIGLVASIDYVLPNMVTMYTGRTNGQQVQVYSTKLDGKVYEYALQMRGVAKKDELWEDPSSKAWRELSTGNILSGVKLSVAGEYEFRVLMREKTLTEVLSEYRGSVTVRETLAYTKTPSPTIHSCNRIILHWDRIFLYGDPRNPALIYLSHVQNPNYFPSLMTLEFINPRREPLTQILHYRNGLLAFTKTSTQILYGTGPEDYRRVMLHTDLGCVSSKGAAVVRNHVFFLSVQGVFALKTIGITDDKANVEKIDKKIANQILPDTDAIALYSDGQFHLVYPSKNTRYRFYDDLSAWTKDISPKFNFRNMLGIDGEIFTTRDGALSKFDTDVYTDEEFVYENYWECKYLSFGQPYHAKKLKELQVLTAPKDEEMTSTIYVYADEEAVINPDDSYASVDETGAVVWNVVVEPNFKVYGGTTFDDRWKIGLSQFGKVMFALNKLRLTGKCLRTRIKFVNEEPKENHVIGFAYIFKVKKA